MKPEVKCSSAELQKDQSYQRFNALAISLVIFLIFLVGLGYSYYRIFSGFAPYDDEGTMMLRIAMLIKDPATYDSLSGPYGPFYYLHKYALHGWLNLPITHDTNRMTTIVLWGMIAAICAVFVFQFSRSIVLAAVVQMQLILLLRGLAAQPGHPQEIALLLISAALLFSSFAIDRRRALPSMIALGAVTGALLLVKLNLGVFLAASVALSILFCLPRNVLVVGLAGASAVAALMLPATIMWRTLDAAWARYYCALVTLVIGASLAVIARSTHGDKLQWRDAGIAATATVVTIVAVCSVILAWGNPLTALANSIFLRAADFTSSFVHPSRVPPAAVAVGIGSFLLAIGYASAAPQIQQREHLRLALACVKLSYGLFSLYSLYQFDHFWRPLRLELIIPLSFLWLVMVRTDAGESDRLQFPRVLLCLLAAFQILQAYPIFATQFRWAVFLIAPLAAICVADGTKTVVEVASEHLRLDLGRGLSTWLRGLLAALFLVLACGVYYRKADIPHLEATYWANTALALPGASRLRLNSSFVDQIHILVKNISAYCDGFVSMPGFGSLYFWTRIPPPAAMNGAWMLNLDDAYQRAIIEKMRTYERPCALKSSFARQYVPKKTRNSAVRGNRPSEELPFVRYIEQHYKPGPKFGPNTLLLGGERPGTPSDTR